MNQLENFWHSNLLYERFHGFPPDMIEKCAYSRVIPPVVMELGELRGIIYRSDKWTPGIKRTYIHFMRNPPKLVSDPGGTQLYIIGGTYRITPRGIEG